MENKEIYIGKDGEESDETTAYIKIVYANEKEYYFAVSFKNDLIDPYEGFFTAPKRLMSKYKKISRSSYENYFRYLKSKNKIYLTRARRLFLED